jgi:protoporphyrinogen IX oxidase
MLLSEVYLWVKAFHVISVIAWMAGMLYLPRLFVYHCRAETGSAQSETFKIMERRLLKAIMNPAMIATWTLGLALVFLGELWRESWIHTKLLFVLGLTVVHIGIGRWRRAFDEDRNQHSERFYRIANEVPAILMVGIVILAVIKPW